MRGGNGNIKAWSKNKFIVPINISRKIISYLYKVVFYLNNNSKCLMILTNSCLYITNNDINWIFKYNHIAIHNETMSSASYGATEWSTKNNRSKGIRFSHTTQSSPICKRKIHWQVSKKEAQNEDDIKCKKDD